MRLFHKPVLIAAIAMSLATTAWAGGPDFIECEMTFSIEGWSVFYKTASGRGKITCDNGQEAMVALRAKGGGLSFGKSRIEDGIGTFSDVTDIAECFGKYVQGEAHAGVGKSSEASVLTKGEVSLALAGVGRGVDIGIAFGAFTIKPLDEK